MLGEAPALQRQLPILTDATIDRPWANRAAYDNHAQAGRLPRSKDVAAHRAGKAEKSPHKALVMRSTFSRRIANKAPKKSPAQGGAFQSVQRS
jgi:hypothetical protein